jgi:3-oxoacyl-[acyl-carrier-protein] synthase-3
LSELLVVPAGGSKIPVSIESLEKNQNFMQMKGREIFKNAVRTMSACAKNVLEQSGNKIEDVSWLVPHQANSRIMEAVASQFDFPMDRVVNVVNEMGNTSAATIPVAFDMAVKDGRIKRGQLVLLTAFGAGLTAGGMILRY